MTTHHRRRPHPSGPVTKFVDGSDRRWTSPRDGVRLHAPRLSLVLRTKDASGLRPALSGRLVDCLAVPIRLPMLSIPMHKKSGVVPS